MKIIRKEITIKAPVEKVWKHLTDPQKIATWFLPTDFEPQVGKSFTLRCEDQGTVECTVREVVPNEKLVYSFKPPAANVETLVSFVLSQRRRDEVGFDPFWLGGTIARGRRRFPIIRTRVGSLFNPPGGGVGEGSQPIC